MNIIVATIGSRGDVQPYINLCQGLQAAGHAVTLATNPTLCSLVEAHGVTSAPVGPAVDMGLEGARLMAQSFDNMWIGLIRVMRLGARLVEAAYPDVLRLCQGADLVVTSDTGSGIAEAEKLGRPWISITLQPGRIPMENPGASPAQRLIWKLIGQLLVAPTNRMRQRLGAPPVRDIASLLSQRLLLLPVSRHVAPPDPHWPAHVHQTNYWFPRTDHAWRAPDDLVEFIQQGERPIAVSLGVMSQAGQQARASVEIVVEALQTAGVRAILQGWPETLRGQGLPNTIYPVGALPHAWLFEHVSAVVHHGGFGTTAAVLRAGVPGIVIPHVIDQFYWGQRVYELGVGPKFITRGRLSAGNLRPAIEQALSDEQLRVQAAELGRRIRSEPDGVATAVGMIERVLCAEAPVRE